MGVLKADNRWWQDVLEHGQASRHADFFDIDWDPESEELAGKVLVPILGEQYGTILERGELKLHFDANHGELTLCYHEHRLPIRPATYPRLLMPGIDRLRARIRRMHLTTSTHCAGLPTPSPSCRRPVRPRGRGAARRSGTTRARGAVCARARRGAVHRRQRAHGERPVGEPSSFDALHALVKAQVWRIAFWRVAPTTSTTGASSTSTTSRRCAPEREDVFEATHRRALDLIAAARPIACASIIPTACPIPPRTSRGCRLRRARSFRATAGYAARVYVVIEKILADHERPARILAGARHRPATAS
jgi:(1->4)-alpha-D-glucan 1-alpha-D-glucosylmutase